MFDSERKTKQAERKISDKIKGFNMKECKALRDLMILYDESQVSLDPPPEVNIDNKIMVTENFYKFKPKLRHFPKLLLCPSVWMFLQKSIRDLKNVQWSAPSSMPINSSSNLSEVQLQAVEFLKTQTEMVIKPSNTGGNIVLMTHTQYQKICMDILNSRE